MTRNLRPRAEGPLGLGDDVVLFENMEVVFLGTDGLVPVDAVGHVPGPIAALGQVIEDEAGGAAVTTGLDAVDADVKVLAVGRVGVQRVGIFRSDGVCTLDVGRAVELDDVCYL